MDLSRPEVGQKGYYFRQTADINCSALSSWTNISFKGHYNGDGHTITYNKNEECLFSSIQAQSSITNLRLKNVGLSVIVEDSYITSCLSTVDLIKDSATNCTINACQAGGSLIGNTATNCTITACESGSFFIRETATSCFIKNCLAMTHPSSVDSTSKSYFILGEGGGIATELTQGSVVERCFVTGKVGNSDLAKAHFSGIAATCVASSIRLCALGEFEAKEKHTRLIHRIANKVSKASTLGKNVSIDSNLGVDDSNGNDGKTVAAALFKQRYFEHTLGWDFDAVWQWDDANNRPALRSAGVGATSQQAKPASQKTNKTDLLTQQMRANIWL